VNKIQRVGMLRLWRRQYSKSQRAEGRRLLWKRLAAQGFSIALDYYLYADHKLLVVEAKNADLARGFTQLAVELIALNEWSDSDTPILQGAVSTGDVWQFGLLNRQDKQITQDLNLYRVPADLEELLRILVASLEP
jgi:hypothetical protein